MPDIPNRDELEKELARRFSRLSSAHRKELLTLLGDPPSYANVPEDFWDKVAGELNGSFVPFLSDVYLDSAERLVEGLPIGVDWALVNSGASNWARQYSFELVTNINRTTRQGLQAIIPQFFEEQMNRGELESRIGRLFSPVRAEMIAVTEVTRAAAEGEKQIAADLARQGIQMIPIWQTRNDEIVARCPICWPRHDKEITDGIYPPGHPRCRCWVNHELPKVEV